MFGRRSFIFAVALFLLPVLVAIFDLSVPVAIAAVFIMLLWRWALSLSSLLAPAKTPELVLETISASHFVEKVRWNLDVAGIDYTERPSAGTLGAYYLARTVPRLNMRTGAVRSSIGNSAEILRYAWGRYAAELGPQAAHLEPTPERLEFEDQLDRHGVNLQVWLYHHLLERRDLTLKAWGADNPAIPAWQRAVVRLLYPVQAMLIRRSFRITPTNAEKAGRRIEEMLETVEMRLADGRASILGGAQLNFTDYSFAAMAGLWLQPKYYGGGHADTCRMDCDDLPEAMRADVERWAEDHPRAVDWVETLYRSRLPEEAQIGVNPEGPGAVREDKRGMRRTG